MEVYQWLLRQNGFKVSDTGYFVYANGKRDRKAFDGRLEFDIKLIPYTGSDKWIAGTLNVIKKCLVDPRIPMAGKNCEYCGYTDAVATTLEEKKREKPGETKSIKKVKKSPIADQDSTLF